MSSSQAKRKLQEGGNDQRELILAKIHTLIDRADPDTWRRGGEKLHSDMHFEKPRKTWEEVYTQQIDQGTLVFRKSTPVTAQFLGKGFNLIPAADPQITVELRAPGWHHSELTDPNRRSQLSDRTCHVLAEGAIAQELLDHVEQTYEAFHNARQKEFDKEALALITMLPARLEEETVDTWDRTEDIPGEVHYTAVVDDCTVDVSRKHLGERQMFALLVSRRNMSSSIKDIELIKTVYECVEELGQTSRLLTLSKALEYL